MKEIDFKQRFALFKYHNIYIYILNILYFFIFIILYYILNYSNISVTFNFNNYRKDKYMHVSLYELFNYIIINNSIFGIDWDN